MKKLNQTILLAMLLSMEGAKTFAHDIAVLNADGKTIYYNIIDISTDNPHLFVTYRGNEYYSYSNEYSGNIVIPASVNYDGATYEVTSIDGAAFYDCTSLISVTIPNSVGSIRDSAFKGCSGLTSVTIGNSVKYIGYGAFEGCNGLTSVTIPNSVTSIGALAFEGCSGLTSVTISNCVKSISYLAFAGCSSLTSVTIPNSVTFINGLAFQDCSGLTSIIIGNCMTSIGSGAFERCSGLTSVIIPNSVTSIGESAFYGCSGLTSVTIPNSVTSIYNKAFDVCSSLTSVKVGMKNPIKIGENTFGNREKATLYVPVGCKAAYEAADYWNEFKEIVELEDESNNNTLFATELEALVGTKVVLPIELTNENEVKLCQFDLQLPADVTVAKKSNGKLDATLTTRADSHSISSQQLSNGNYRFIVSSMDNDSFTGNSGTLMEITLDIPATMEAGEYTVKVLNAELSVPNGNDLKVVKPTDTESKLTVKAYTPGDVNNDGSVSVTDVGCTINYILEQVPSVFVFEAADMNGDKTVSVTDVGMIINLILNEGVSGSRGMVEENVNNDYHFSPNLSLQATAEGYELQLEDKDAFIGFQFDMELGDGATINGVQLNGADDSDHLLTYRRLDNGKWRVVCYSPTNSTFVGDDDALLTISTTGDITVSDVRLTTAGLDELRPAALVSMPTGVANVEQGMKMGVQGNTLCITSDRDTTLRLLTIGDSTCRILHVHRGQNSFDGLRAGIYMIDNKKIIIR